MPYLIAYVKKGVLLAVVFALVLAILFSCAGCEDVFGSDKLIIISGSENTTLEPLIQDFARKNGVSIEMKYKGSVDIMQELASEDIGYDAVWPANSLWISLGDIHHAVKHHKSIMTSPVVFAVKMSVAESLGFVGRQVSVNDILQAITEKKLTFMMTSASQSNSGASAYIGFLYALLGNPETITIEDLNDSDLKERITSLLSGINRSAGSSEWLKDLFLKGDYDAMVNYESVVIEANHELVRSGREPLYLIYPYDGLVIADSPLGYVNRGDAKKEEIFLELQQYLLSEEIQAKILKLGRRTGFGGVIENPDTDVFNPEWGIDPDKVLSPIKMPSADVIKEAINLYQTEFRKPSYTVFCLDFSGSMYNNGDTELKEAMDLLLDKEKARDYFLQFTSRDVIAVIPFNDGIIDIWKVEGNDAEKLHELSNKIRNMEADGGTDIYTPVIEGLRLMNDIDPDIYSPAVILMTDGESNRGRSFDDLESYWQGAGKDIPVFSILFGEASEQQLEDIAELTMGRLFDGKNDLINAFKKVRGYN